jgi:hypothetical protein
MADRLFPPLKVKKSNDDDDDDDDCEDRPRKPVAGKKKKTYYTLSPKVCGAEERDFFLFLFFSFTSLYCSFTFTCNSSLLARFLSHFIRRS